jgi:hypothetical protein
VLHLTATIRRRDNHVGDTTDPDGQIDVDADTYDTARQAVLDQLADGWIVTAYRVDRPTDPS